ncbi:MAG: hypothetical protein NC238_06265 [Dehalobacter sp.]|nr:hypothetical protein [Dehalobacter sp.]
MKVSKRGFITISLFILAFIIGTTTGTGFSFGDELFLFLGIPLWSNGQMGFHTPSIVAIILFIIACICAKAEVPRLRIAVLILFFIVLSPMLVSIIKPAYFKIQNGLAAVEYEYKRSHFDIRSTADNKDLDITGYIVLTNYGRDELKVGIKIPLDGYMQQIWFSKDVILTGSNISEKDGIFTLPPGETQTISIFTEIPSKDGNNHKGSMNGPNLILSTDNEVRTVGYGHL